MSIPKLLLQVLREGVEGPSFLTGICSRPEPARRGCDCAKDGPHWLLLVSCWSDSLPVKNLRYDFAHDIQMLQRKPEQKAKTAQVAAALGQAEQERGQGAKL